MNVHRQRIIECKKADSLMPVRHVCKCGHTVYVPVKYEFVYCDWCFRRVWRDEKTKFKYKLMAKLGKINNEQVQKQKSRSR